MLDTARSFAIRWLLEPKKKPKKHVIKMLTAWIDAPNYSDYHIEDTFHNKVYDDVFYDDRSVYLSVDDRVDSYSKNSSKYKIQTLDFVQFYSIGICISVSHFSTESTFHIPSIYRSLGVPQTVHPLLFIQSYKYAKPAPIY